MHFINLLLMDVVVLPKSHPQHQTNQPDVGFQPHPNLTCQRQRRMWKARCSLLRSLPLDQFLVRGGDKVSQVRSLNNSLPRGRMDTAHQVRKRRPSQKKIFLIHIFYSHCMLDDCFLKIRQSLSEYPLPITLQVLYYKQIMASRLSQFAGEETPEKVRSKRLDSLFATSGLEPVWFVFGICTVYIP